MRQASRLGKPISQDYGITETSPVTHANPIAAPILESIGPAITGTEDRIVDLETGTKVLATDEVGEICVRGPQIMRGYWNKPQDTADVIRDGWFHTGDVGRKDERGYVFIVDRKKEFIKYKGFGVGPAEVEAVLCEHPAIADAGVIGKADAEAGEIPKAFVQLRPNTTATADEIMAFVKERIADYKRVREVEFIDKVPRTASGQILRRELADRARRFAQPDARGWSERDLPRPHAGAHPENLAARPLDGQARPARPRAVRARGRPARSVGAWRVCGTPRPAGRGRGGRPAPSRGALAAARRGRSWARRGRRPRARRGDAQALRRPRGRGHPRDVRAQRARRARRPHAARVRHRPRPRGRVRGLRGRGCDPAARAGLDRERVPRTAHPRTRLRARGASVPHRSTPRRRARCDGARDRAPRRDSGPLAASPRAGACTTRRSRRADRRPPGGRPRRAAWRAGPRPHIRCDARRGERARGDRERTPPARCAHRGRRRVRRVRPLALPRGSRRRSRRCRHPPHAPPPGGRRDTRDRSGTTS